MTSGSDPRYWIGFDLVPGVGPMRLNTLIEAIGSIEACWNASEQQLRDAGLPDALAAKLVERRAAIDLDYELEKLERHNVEPIPIDNQRYPRLLRHIPGAPSLLYVKGTLLPTDELAIGVVGTRRSTTYGADMTWRIVGDLARAGVTIISGLALGIDSVAHRAALDAGGRTIAVFGCGLDIVYPPQNRRLADQVIEHGALVSDYPIGAKPDGRNFPARNRIISGLSRGILVIEAPRRSGALITASFAGDQGRDVFAVPGSALSNASAGNHALIRDGATLVTDAEQILEELSVEAAYSAVQTRMALPESPDERTLYEIIGAEPRHVDELARESGLTIQATNGTLLAMELKGLVRQSGTQHYVRT